MSIHDYIEEIADKFLPLDELFNIIEISGKINSLLRKLN